MITFDDLTLAEVEDIETEFGKELSELSGLRAAGAVLWIERRRANPLLQYAEFRVGVHMSDLKAWIEAQSAADVDPFDGTATGSSKNALGSGSSGISPLANIAS